MDDKKEAGKAALIQRGALAKHSEVIKHGLRPSMQSIKVAGTRFDIEKSAAVDKVTKDRVAIKKIPRAFDDVIDSKRVLREIKLLTSFDHENFHDVYLVCDFMETDLHRIIYSKQVLTDNHIQYFIYQLLCGLKYIHSANVIHRDLKPSNILLNEKCDLKICDFGLARGIDETIAASELTEYVVTRWYRAPEIMLSCQQYSKAVDVWSTGCIFAELLGRRPLFPGDDYIHQLQLISDIIGSPSFADLHFVTSEKARAFMLSQPHKPKIPFDTLYPDAPPGAIDLLTKMLHFDPKHRITVVDALNHPYLSSLHHEEEEHTCEVKLQWDFETRAFNVRSVQALILDEIKVFHPEEVAAFRSQAAIPSSHGGISHASPVQTAVHASDNGTGAKASGSMTSSVVAHDTTMTILTNGINTNPDPDSDDSGSDGGRRPSSSTVMEFMTPFPSNKNAALSDISSSTLKSPAAGITTAVAAASISGHPSLPAPTLASHGRDKDSDPLAVSAVSSKVPLAGGLPPPSSSTPFGLQFGAASPRNRFSPFPQVNGSSSTMGDYSTRDVVHSPFKNMLGASDKDCNKPSSNPYNTANTMKISALSAYSSTKMSGSNINGSRVANSDTVDVEIASSSPLLSSSGSSSSGLQTVKEKEKGRKRDRNHDDSNSGAGGGVSESPPLRKARTRNSDSLEG